MAPLSIMEFMFPKWVAESPFIFMIRYPRMMKRAERAVVQKNSSRYPALVMRLDIVILCWMRIIVMLTIYPRIKDIQNIVGVD